MKTVSIQEKFNLQFVVALHEYEETIFALRKTKFKTSFVDVTKENSPLTFAEGRPEVLITVHNVTVTDAAFIKQFLNNLS